jgi:hypothetical protein
MKRKLHFGLLVTIVLLGGLSVYAGSEFWEVKPYTQWSLKECEKILEYSPWAKEYVLTGVPVPGDSAIDRQYQAGIMDSKPLNIKYKIQFQSARTVREALIRQRQILEKYDAFTPEKKQQFDKQAQDFFATAPADQIIVSVKYSSNSAKNNLDLAHYWQTRTLEQLKNSIYLIGAKGVKVPIKQYTSERSEKREFTFVFPRQHNGKDIVSPEDKSLKLEFAYPVISMLGDGNGMVEFDVKKMIAQGKIVY